MSLDESNALGGDFGVDVASLRVLCCAALMSVLRS